MTLKYIWAAGTENVKRFVLVIPGVGGKKRNTSLSFFLSTCHPTTCLYPLLNGGLHTVKMWVLFNQFSEKWVKKSPLLQSFGVELCWLG